MVTLPIFGSVLVSVNLTPQYRKQKETKYFNAQTHTRTKKLSIVNVSTNENRILQKGTHTQKSNEIVIAAIKPNTLAM